MTELTAEAFLHQFTQLPSNERSKFFTLVAQRAFSDRDQSHQEVFGHLAGDEFTSMEAAEYLDISMSTFRRYVRDGRITASNGVGRSQLFATKGLKEFKRALREVRG